MGVLKAVENAVPVSGVHITRQYAEARWVSCDGLAGTFGWSDISVQLTFDASPDTLLMMSYVTSGMETIGWTIDNATGPSLMEVNQRFSRTLTNGAEAFALLLPWDVKGHTPGWQLTAVAPPEGPRATGC
jgi:hypothetical protein